jgi:drug/metabolite transporter (DMT)-like permease
MKAVEGASEKKFLTGMMLSMFCWGLSWPVGKMLASYGAAETISFFRFLTTFISLLFLLLIVKENLSIKKQGIPLLIVASICMTAYGYFFLEGLSKGKAGAGGVLVTTLNPIITYLLIMVLSLQPPSYKEIAGLMLGLAAGCVLLQVWNPDLKIFDKGNLYFVSATLTWAVLSRFTSTSGHYGSPLSFSLWMYGLCTLFMLFISAPQENLRVLQKADFSFWGNMFFSATITTSLATTYYFYATTKIGASKASSFIFLVPLSAAAGAWIMLGEIPLWNTLAGGALGLLAVYILNKKEKK